MDRSSSMDITDRYLGDCIGFNSVTKVISFVETLEYTQSLEQMFHVAANIRGVLNHPVPSSPFLKVYPYLSFPIQRRVFLQFNLMVEIIKYSNSYLGR